MLPHDKFHMKVRVWQMIKIPIENVLKLLPLKLVIMNEFGVNFCE